CHGAHAGDDVGDGAVLEHVAFDAEVERGVEDVLVAVDREEDDLDGQPFVADGARHPEAVELGHLNVEDGHARLQFFNLGERLAPVARFGDDFQPRVRLGRLPPALPYDGGGVGGQDFNLTLHSS